VSTIFCDTSGFYAVTVPDDRFHGVAAKAWRSLLLDGHNLVTTNYIVLEILTLLQSRFGLDTAKQLYEAIKQNVQIHGITSALHDAAVEDVFRSGKRNLSIVDCSSFAFMRHSHIATTFTCDSHFEEHGFETFRARSPQGFP